MRGHHGPDRLDHNHAGIDEGGHVCYVKNASGGQEELLLEKGGCRPTGRAMELVYTKGGVPQTEWYRQ
jgi:hypothetical protein